MTISTPTVADFEYGPKNFHRADISRNATRLDVDAQHPLGQNPILFWRHGGGGVGGDYIDCRDSTISTFWHFWRWLLGDYPATAPARCWDVCWFTSAQQTWTPFGGFGATRIQRSESTFHPGTVRDCQHAIASLKHFHRALGFNPAKSAGGGDSFGAYLIALSQIGPPLRGSGGQSTWLEGTREPGTHDSRLTSLVYHQGQIDWRRPAGVQTFTTAGYSGYFGTATSTQGAQASLDAVPEAILESASLMHYLERAVADPNEVQDFPGVCTVWTPQGAHVKPYPDLHDSDQQATLNAALLAAAIPSATLTLAGAGLNNTNYPAGPSGSVLARYQLIENFMAARLVAG